MAGDSDGKGVGFNPFNVEGAWPTRPDQKTASKIALSEMNLWSEDPDFNYCNSEEVVSFWLSLKK